MTVGHVLLWAGVLFGVLGIVLSVIIRVFPKDKLEAFGERTSTISPFLSLVAGAAVTLAAAATTLGVANAAERISLEQRDIAAQQNERDLYDNVNSQADDIHKLYASLAISIAHVIRGGLGVLGHYHICVEEEGGCEELPANVIVQVNIFLDSLEALDQALHKVQVHRTANLLLSVEEIDGAVRFITGEPANVVGWLQGFVKSDWMDFRQLVHGSKVALKEDPVSSIGEAYCAVLLNGDGGPLDGNGLEPLQWVAFTGYLIFVKEDTVSGAEYISSLGLAMLHDLYWAIPNGAAIVDYLREVPGAEGMELELPFERRLMVGYYYADALDMLRSRFDLMFMKGSCKC